MIRATALLGPALLLLVGCGDPGSGAVAPPPVSATVGTGAAAREARPALRVRVATVREGRVSREGEASGIVRAFRKTTVASEVAGRVIERLVEPGAHVEAGQPLVALDATRLELVVQEALATLEARKVDVAEARNELERGEQLFRENTVSDSQLDALRFGLDRAESALALAQVALRSARRDLADTRVAAPFASTVETVHAEVGDHLSPGEPVATLVDLSRARLHVGVTASEASGLVPGASASASFDVLGGLALPGEIRSIGRVADPASGTYDVEVWLDNEDGRLREGMVARVRLPHSSQDVYPVVPRTALIRRDGQMSIFVVEGKGAGARAVARPARVGRSSQRDVELLAGAALGERVVVDGLFALRDGAPVIVEADLALGATETATP